MAGKRGSGRNEMLCKYCKYRGIPSISTPHIYHSESEKRKIGLKVFWTILFVDFGFKIKFKAMVIIELALGALVDFLNNKSRNCSASEIVFF